MSKVESKCIGNNVVFRNFVVVKKKDDFFEVYRNWFSFDERCCGESITSGATLDKACKKAKLLQIGYDLAKEQYVRERTSYLEDLED